MAVITISREFGSGGGNIARALAKELGYSFLDKESLGEILTNYGLAKNNIEKYDEKKPPFWDIFTSDREKYLGYMKLAIFEFLKEGRGIILGRGASILLKGVPDCLHVRIIAPLKQRIERVKNVFKVTDAQAEQIIRSTHHDRSGFYKFFFDAAWESPLLYDLVLNTGAISEERAVRILEVESRFLSKREKEDRVKEKLQDRYIGQKIQTNLLFEKHLAVNFLSVEVKNGKAILEGSAPAQEIIDRCGEECRKVKGISDVENKIALVTAYPVSYTPYY